MLVNQLKITSELPDEQFDPCLVIDEGGEVHTVLCDQDLYHMVLAYKAKVARKFHNWVLHSVPPALLLHRFFFLGDERGGTPSHQTLDPKVTFLAGPSLT
jgi:prophage antirepressor-like protein